MFKKNLRTEIENMATAYNKYLNDDEINFLVSISFNIYIVLGAYLLSSSNKTLKTFLNKHRLSLVIDFSEENDLSENEKDLFKNIKKKCTMFDDDTLKTCINFNRYILSEIITDSIVNYDYFVSLIETSKNNYADVINLFS